MTLGNVLALWQDDLRRLLAYSSIAHAGYMLIGLAVGLAAGNAPGPWNGIGGLGVLSGRLRGGHASGRSPCWNTWAGPTAASTRVDELAGLGRTRPAGGRRAGRVHVQSDGRAAAGRLLGKAAGLRQCLERRRPGRRRGRACSGGSSAVAIVGVLNAAVAAAYYLRIVAVMYFRTPLATPRAQGGAGAWWAAVACALLVSASGFIPAR